MDRIQMMINTKGLIVPTGLSCQWTDITLPGCLSSGDGAVVNDMTSVEQSVRGYIDTQLVGTVVLVRMKYPASATSIVAPSVGFMGFDGSFDGLFAGTEVPQPLRSVGGNLKELLNVSDDDPLVGDFKFTIPNAAIHVFDRLASFNVTPVVKSPFSCSGASAELAILQAKLV